MLDNQIIEITKQQIMEWQSNITNQITRLKRDSHNLPMLIIMTDYQYEAILRLTGVYGNHYKPTDYFGAEVILISHDFEKYFNPKVYIKADHFTAKSYED